MRQLMLILLVTATMAFGQKEANTTGQHWRNWTDQMRLAYVRGFMSGYLVGAADSGLMPSQLAHSSSTAARFLRCLGSMTFGQQVAIIDKYIADHPEKWDSQIDLLFGEAMKKACAQRTNE